MPTIKGFKVGTDTYLYEDQNIAEEFSTTKTYKVGNYVINSDDGLLYRCHTAITTGGSWTGAANWINVKGVGDTDKMLSTTSMAADAYQTGQLKEAINAALYEQEFGAQVESGYWSIEDGSKKDSSKYVRTKSKWKGNGKRSAIALNNSTYKSRLIFFDSNGTVVGSTGNDSIPVKYISENAAEFAINITRTDSANMTSADMATIEAGLKAYGITDTALQESNKPADAKATGDAIDELRAVIGTEENLSGEYVTVNTDIDGLPPKQIAVDFLFEQSGTGDPGPSNIRPIIGYTECTVTDEGEDSQNKTVTVNWEDRYPVVYGGRVVFNQDGTAKLIRKYHQLQVGNLTWTKVTGNNYRNFWATSSTYPPKYIADTPTVFSSHYKSVAANSGTSASADNYIWVWNNNGTPVIAIKDTSKANMTAKEFRAAIADVQIVYEIATPIKVNYPSDQLQLYKGENNISSNIGEVSVSMTTGLESLKLYSDYEFNVVKTEFDVIKATEEANKLGLHTIPSSIGQLNTIKRARQITDVKWTPAIDLPRHMLIGEDRWNTIFKAGVEYTGIPYGESDDQVESRYGYPRLSVGLETSVETFVTAVSCADSIMSEDVGSVAKHQSTVYSCACDSLVCYALNAPYKYTPSIPTISGMVEVGKIIDDGNMIDLTTLKLGDVLHMPAHVGIITDIVTDSSGNVTVIEISEETSTGEDIIGTVGRQEGGLAKRRGYSISMFINFWGKYTVYRYAGIDDTPYTPSDYVDVGDELNMQRYDRFACLPYEGSGFRYKTGYIPNNTIKILIEASGYDYLRVFKDGTEIASSPIAVGENDNYVNVTEIGAGSYEAYLCRMSGGENTTKTHNCHWSVIG